MNLQEMMDKEFVKGMEAGREQGLSQGKAEGMAQGMAQGLSQGMAQEKLKNAKSMKTAGIDLSIINTVTGLSLAEIQEL